MFNYLALQGGQKFKRNIYLFCLFFSFLSETFVHSIFSDTVVLTIKLDTIKLLSFFFVLTIQNLKKKKRRNSRRFFVLSERLLLFYLNLNNLENSSLCMLFYSMKQVHIHFIRISRHSIKQCKAIIEICEVSEEFCNWKELSRWVYFLLLRKDGDFIIIITQVSYLTDRSHF